MTERIFRVKVQHHGDILTVARIFSYLIVANTIGDIPKKVRTMMKKRGRSMRRIVSIKDLGERDA